MSLEITAVLMGLAGSLHCVGMCSPLAIAVSKLTPRLVFNKLVYNLGRIMVYGMMGAIVASFGYLLPFAKYQTLIAAILGVALVSIGLLGIRNYNIPGLTFILNKVTVRLKQLFSSQLKTKSYASIFLLGSINGFLPCGLTMVALTVCVGLQGPVDGFQFMMLFGFGTLPVMLGFTSMATVLLNRFHISFKTLTSATMFVTGALLIARVFFFHAHGAEMHQSVVEIILCGK